MNILGSDKYLRLTYDEVRLPRTNYPAKLAEYICLQYLGVKGRILDVGCGRAEYLKAFSDLGLEAIGIDISPAAPQLARNHEVKVADLEQESVPYPDDSFDYAFTKSLLEHTRHPVRVLQAIWKVLKPRGRAVVMVPAWETGYKGSFYIDHTHVTPFTLPSLEDAVKLAGFEIVHSQYFYQLPFLWGHPYLKALVWLIAVLPIPYRPMHKVGWPDRFNKLIWFSKEKMLLVIGEKPQLQEGAAA